MANIYHGLNNSFKNGVTKTGVRPVFAFHVIASKVRYKFFDKNVKQFVFHLVLIK
jgi:hypothetical protein